MPAVFDLTPTLAEADTPTSGSFAEGWAGSQGVFEVSGSNIVFYLDDKTQVEGSWLGSALNYGATVVLTNPAGAAAPFQSGSWHGSAMNNGATVVLTNPAGAAAPFQSGSWLGSNAMWGVNGASLENHDKVNTVDDEHANVGEGANVGEYNPFPVPPAEPKEPQRVRDATRFQKAYSFSRNQPVRIRVFKR